MDSTPVKASAHLVDPGLRAFLEVWPIHTLDETTLGSVRAIFQQMLESIPAEVIAEVAQKCLREQHFIPGRAGQPQVRALMYRPKNSGAQKRTGVFHIHGGGLVSGAPEFSEDRNVAILEDHGCVVLAPAYRLAPETKFPGALEDLYTALKWFHDNADAFGLDRDGIIIVGESAGGGLAAALTMLVRDRGEFQLSGQILVYPMIDDRTGSVEERGKYSGEFIWTAAMNRFSWNSYLPCAAGSPNVPSYAAAARATDLAGLPPTFIFTGALDLFLKENLDFANRLIDAGVPLGLHIYPGAFHAFDRAPDSGIAQDFVDDFNRALSSLISRHSG